MAPAFGKLMLTWRGTQGAAKERRGKALWMQRSRTLGPAHQTDIHRGVEAGGQETGGEKDLGRIATFLKRRGV